MPTQAFGIDIGGSGIKGAPVDIETGNLTANRVRIPTPQPSTPEAVASTVAELLSQFDDDFASIGITVPCIVSSGVTTFAANLDKKWIGCPAAQILSEAAGREITLLNDADAAGIAETYYGAARERSGLVILTTLGTGIGTAIIYNGILVPNSELGHVIVDGYDAETRAAASVRTNEDLSWPDYTARLQRYYETLEFLFSPDLFIVGGGISKDADKFIPFLKLKAEIVPAQLRNQAGIVGVARYAFEAQGR